MINTQRFFALCFLITGAVQASQPAPRSTKSAHDQPTAPRLRGIPARRWRTLPVAGNGVPPLPLAVTTPATWPGVPKRPA